MNRRALRAATMGVLLFTPVAVTACSAGQTPQTSAQVRDKAGPIGQVGDITLRAVELAYPPNGIYRAGDDARLQLVLVNNGNAEDTLVSITGDGFDGVRVGNGGATGSASPDGAAPTSGTAPTTSAAPESGAATGSASGSGSPSATGSAAPTGSATATGSVPATGAAGTGAATAATSSPSPAGHEVGIRIPADSSLFLGKGGVPNLTLVGLHQRLLTGQTIEVTFTFDKAGSITLQALVAAPGSEVPRTSSYNFEVPTEANNAGVGG